MDFHTTLWISGGLLLGSILLAAVRKIFRDAGEGFAPSAGVSTTLDDVKRLVAAGKKIQAIKLYREIQIHPVSLAEAKALVENLQGGPAPNRMAELAPQLEEVRRLAAEGQKIMAIKLFREITGAGLKEAKDAVESGQYDPVPSLPSAVESPSLETVRQTAREGNLIMAIKMYLDLHPGVGLAECKEAVERMVRNG